MPAIASSTLSVFAAPGRSSRSARKCALIRFSSRKLTGLTEKSFAMIQKHSSICYLPSLTFKISPVSSSKRSAHTAENPSYCTSSSILSLSRYCLILNKYDKTQLWIPFDSAKTVKEQRFIIV